MPNYLGRHADWEDDYDEEIPVYEYSPKTAAIEVARILFERSEKDQYGWPPSFGSKMTVKIRPAAGGSTMVYEVEPILKPTFVAIEKET